MAKSKIILTRDFLTSEIPSRPGKKEDESGQPEGIPKKEYEEMLRHMKKYSGL